MAFPPALLVLLALCFYTLEVSALPDPRYVNFYGQVKHGPPVQARKLPTFQTFDPNSVCTLASQQQSSLNGYDYAFCCKEDSPLLDFWLGLSFQTCSVSLATNQSTLCSQYQKLTCCTSDDHPIKRTCNIPNQNSTTPVNCTYHEAAGTTCANETLRDALTKDQLDRLLHYGGITGI